MTELCLMLLAPKALEENLLDHLLSRTDLLPNPQQLSSLGACASQPASLLGIDPKQLNAREQVLGQGDALLLHVFVDASQADPLIAELSDRFLGSGLRYWLLPVVAMGEC